MAGAHTLPKNFTFFSPGDSEPRTPDRPLRDLPNPPRPQHASHRVRRRRLERKPIPFCAPDVPLPSIELSRIPAETASELQCITSSMLAGFLEVPPRERIDPKTPPAQIRDTVSESEQHADGTATPIGASISRPSSACSNASDSSLSSSESLDSFDSLGGSCTSPETEIDDPFLATTLPDNKYNQETPSKSFNNAPVPAHLAQTSRWSSEMDSHLWNTYQTHLQDPTITPFKMLPGSLPPLGVSHRVAREARRAWIRTKQCQSQPQSQSTDCAATNNRAPQQWPRSDASTRRRLKELCKKKHFIAPHYQRLLQSRSPSPPPDMFSNYTTVTSATPAPFTRDLGVSLVSGTLPSDPSEAEPASTPNIVSNTARTMVATAEGDIPRLGSPFMYHTWGPSIARTSRGSQTDTTPVQSGVEAHDTLHVTGSRLRSGMPPDLFTPNSQHHPTAAAPVQLPIPEVDIKESTPQRVRIRTRARGLTTNSTSSSMLNVNSRHRLIQLFTPPSASCSTSSSNTDDPSSQTLEAEGEGIKRLGSPFNLDLPASKRPQQHPRQYRRPRHAPSRSDTFLMHPHTNTQEPSHFPILSSTADIATSDAEHTPTPTTALHSPAV